jgi:hypothetical protein
MAKKKRAKKMNYTKLAVGGVTVALGAGAGLAGSLILPVVAANQFAAIGDLYTGKETSFAGWSFRIVGGVAATAAAAAIGGAILGAAAVPGLIVVGTAGTIVGTVWPVAAPMARGWTEMLTGAEPGGIGALLEGSAASLDAEMQQLGVPGGADEDYGYDYGGDLAPAGVGELIPAGYDEYPAGVDDLGGEYLHATAGQNLFPDG